MGCARSLALYDIRCCQTAGAVTLTLTPINKRYGRADVPNVLSVTSTVRRPCVSAHWPHESLATLIVYYLPFTGHNTTCVSLPEKAPRMNEGTKKEIKARALTAAVFLAEVGEPPDVAEADAESQDGEEELQRRAPLRAGVLLGGVGAVVEI